MRSGIALKFQVTDEKQKEKKRKKKDCLDVMEKEGTQQQEASIESMSPVVQMKRLKL